MQKVQRVLLPCIIYLLVVSIRFLHKEKIYTSRGPNWRRRLPPAGSAGQVDSRPPRPAHPQHAIPADAAGTEVIFCDLQQIPGAMGRMIVTMMAAIAEFEAGLIGERTKAGLKEAKRQGKEWGGTNPKSLQIKHEAMARA